MRINPMDLIGAKISDPLPYKSKLFSSPYIFSPPANNNNQIVKNKDNTMQKLCIVVLIIVTMVHCRTKVSVWENPGYTGSSILECPHPHSKYHFNIYFQAEGPISTTLMGFHMENWASWLISFHP